MLLAYSAKPTRIAPTATKLYWNDSTTGVFAVTLGTYPPMVTPISTVIPTTGLATDGTNVFWSQFAIVEYDGQTVSTLAPGGGGAVTVAGTDVYWLSNQSIDTVSTLSPGNASLFHSLSSTNYAYDMTADGTDVFWAGVDLSKADRSGPDAGVPQELSPLGGNAVAVDGANVFWGDGSTIRNIAKAGGTPAVLATMASGGRLATDGVFVYFADYDRIGRVPVGGGKVDDVLPSNTLSGYVSDVAVDGSAVYFSMTYGADGVYRLSPK